jgi:hypothetical protein
MAFAVLFEPKNRTHSFLQLYRIWNKDFHAFFFRGSGSGCRIPTVACAHAKFAVQPAKAPLRSSNRMNGKDLRAESIGKKLSLGAGLLRCLSEELGLDLLSLGRIKHGMDFCNILKVDYLCHQCIELTERADSNDHTTGKFIPRNTERDIVLSLSDRLLVNLVGHYICTFYTLLFEY